jgi:hypothetical protein
MFLKKYGILSKTITCVAKLFEHAFGNLEGKGEEYEEVGVKR